ncbi:hydrolase, partial [Flavobacterium sp. LM5]
KNNSYGLGIVFNPFENYDYYEPRQSGRYVITPTSYGFWAYYSRNYNYKFAFDINPEYFRSDEPGRDFIGVTVSPRYRFNDKMAVVYDFGFSRRNNNKGYIDKVENTIDASLDKMILFANRNVVTYSHNISGKYSINSQVNFNLLVRQYWSYAENKNILQLAPNGRLVEFMGYNLNKNSSFYSWNMDLSCSWWFAPGSQVSFLYRNSSANFEDLINKNYRDNLNTILTNEKLQHTLSISVRYFIDYNEAKNLFIKS